ncbi:MAG: CoA-binding protein [Candidatus Pacebacteria bacterium]|nr:CoA-binding protein [Candidatus Paceibacterota bacterium]
MLSAFFNPQSVAVIGANDRPGSVGLGVCRNLAAGESQRKIFFVNPNLPNVLGRETYTSILAIPQVIDLAVIAVPFQFVLDVARQCAQKKVKGVVVISSGFSEMGEEGEKRQEELKQILAQNQIPLLGPNCLGLIIPHLQLNVSFSPATPKEGDMAFLSQSGALIDSIIDKSLAEWYGFSALISYGNEADLDISDLLGALGDDPKTKVIAIYLESIKNGQKFIEIASKVTKKKPVVVLKGGQTDLGQRAAVSHTAALAGVAEIYSAAFEKAGIFEVETIEELLYVSLSLGWSQPCENDVAVLTNGGAAGVLTADWCSRLGINLPKLTVKTIDKLLKSPVINQSFSRSNPLDILGDALSDRYEVALNALLEQKDVHGLIVIQTIQVMTEIEKNSRVIISAAHRFQKPILSLILGGQAAGEGIKILSQNKISCFTEPKTAILALKALIVRNSLAA